MFKKLTGLLIATALITVSAGASASLGISTPEELLNDFVLETEGSGDPDPQNTPLARDDLPAEVSAPWDALFEARPSYHTPAGGVAVTDCGDRTPHPPIIIQGDEMFNDGTAVGVVNPDADGTADDPYIIEGWCIMPGVDTPVVTSVDPETTGIEISDTRSHVVVRDNTIPGSLGVDTGGFRAGIALQNATHVTLAENTISQSFDGIVLSDSREVAIRDNTITDSGWFGVSLRDSPGVTVHHNTFDTHQWGVSVHGSDGAVVQDNTVTGTRVGSVALSGSNGVTLDNNTISAEWYGAFLWDSPGTKMRNNELFDSGVVIESRRSLLSDYEQDIDASNTVNEKPIRYVLGETDVTVPGPAGQVILVDTVRAQVTGLDLSETSRGIALVSAEDTTISETTISDNVWGVILTEAANGTTIHDSTIHNNNIGVSVSGTDGLTIHDSIVTDNIWGVHMFDSHAATIRGSTITGSGFGGVGLFSSDADARDNWWGAADGPNSGAGDTPDACTGTTAEGTGDKIVADDAVLTDDDEPDTWWKIINDVLETINPLGESEVCFEPWLSAPNPDAGAA